MAQLPNLHAPQGWAVCFLQFVFEFGVDALTVFKWRADHELGFLQGISDGFIQRQIPTHFPGCTECRFVELGARGGYHSLVITSVDRSHRQVDGFP